jgi:flagellar hook assembly protein FlgD
VGQKIKDISQTIYTKGTHCNVLEWDGKSKSNEKMPQGIYIYRIIAQSNNGSAVAAQQLYLR